MSLHSNAATDEKDSPFYKSNKELCERWEQFVLQHNGQFDGVFNAWSFNIKAKLKTEKTWLISVKKATYSNGFLLFSSKYQNLQEILEFQTDFSKSGCPDFHIVNSWWKRKKVNHPLYAKIASIIDEEKKGKDPITAKCVQGKLTLTFHHRNDDFELVNRILEIHS